MALAWDPDSNCSFTLANVECGHRDRLEPFISWFENLFISFLIFRFICERDPTDYWEQIMVEAFQFHILKINIPTFPFLSRTFNFFPSLGGSGYYWRGSPGKRPWGRWPIVTEARAAHYPIHSYVLPPCLSLSLSPLRKMQPLSKGVMAREVLVTPPSWHVWRREVA